MFVNRTFLPHLLEPAAYYDPAFAARERQVIGSSWHLVGTGSELAPEGSFVTHEVGDVPIIVRGGRQLRGFVNVCAHRHCKIRSEPHGVSAELRCQYHGWGYNERGYVNAIPDRSGLAGIDEREFRLRPVQVAALEDLVFVCLSMTGAPLHDQLGAPHAMLVDALKGARLIASWRETYEANWKIPVENSLESYHLPSVHSGAFSSPPDPGEMHHRLERSFTVFEHFIEMSRRRVSYVHVHCFPCLTFSLTPFSLVLQTFTPVTPTRCTSQTLVYARQQEGATRLLGRFIERTIVRMTRRIQREDQRIFPQVQAGLLASPHRGVLSIREERIHAFQQWLVERLKANETTMGGAMTAIAATTRDA